MIIKLSPVFHAPELTVSKVGDCLIINGVEYDFTPLGEGDVLPNNAVNCEHIEGDITRENGEVCITIKLRNTPDSTDAAKFPEPLHITTDGVVELPL